jgi:hypothetical protein
MKSKQHRERLYLHKLVQREKSMSYVQVQGAYYNLEDVYDFYRELVAIKKLKAMKQITPNKYSVILDDTFYYMLKYHLCNNYYFTIPHSDITIHLLKIDYFKADNTRYSKNLISKSITECGYKLILKVTGVPRHYNLNLFRSKMLRVLKEAFAYIKKHKKINYINEY